MSFQTIVYGKYFLLDRIAVGGMAEVFKAKTFGVHGFERLLVIKRILPHLSKDEEFVEMFIDEAKISVELSHANICQVTDLGKIGDNYFIAMEYIDGKDLRAILKKCYQEKIIPSIPQAVSIAIDILKGLGYAHTKIDAIAGKPLNIIHRDVSPQNVMISYEGEIKIVDFGIAKTEAKLGRTQAGVLKGKFGYMSPEQAAGLELDQRTDIFSVGIILFETFTGRRLFLGENDFETLEKIKECNVPAPSKYNQDITPELEQIILKALAKEKEDRFTSAQEMQSALARIFYTAYPDFSPKNLSDFLKSLFEKEIAEEKEALRRAMDKLPKKEVAAASIAVDAPSGQPSYSGFAPSPSLRAAPIAQSSDDIDPFAPPRKRLSSVAAIGIVLSTVLVTVVIGWKWLSPSSTAPPKETPIVAKSAAATQTVEVLTDPPGAEIYMENKRQGMSPATLQVEPKRWYLIRFTREGFQPLEEKIFVNEDQSTYGPYRLEPIAPKLGTLLIESSPSGAKIFLNEKSTDWTTPATLQDLELDKGYWIRLELKGYQSAQKKIFLSNQEEKAVLQLKPQMVTLRINVEPIDARVLIDGRERGHTIENLKAGGTYDLLIEAKGHLPATKKITLNDPVEEINITLKKQEIIYGNINLGALPWAKIFIDGKEAGQSPLLDHRLPIGEHTILFQHPEFGTVQKTINIKKGKNDDLIIDFRS